MSSRIPAVRVIFLALMALVGSVRAEAESGYDFWLRYLPIEDSALRDSYRKAISSIVVYPTSPSPMREQWNDPSTTPDKFLLWFHRLPWDYRLRLRAARVRWTALRGRVDGERHQAVARKLRQQVEDAAAWRDKCLKYFQQFSKRPLSSQPEPREHARPEGRAY